MRSCFVRLAYSLVFSCFGADAGVAADPGVEPSTLCTAAILAAEQRYNTPIGLLATIGRVESGRPVGPTNAIQPWPWTINADGAALFFDRRAQATAWLQAAGSARSTDIGCMQINLQMHPAAFASPAEAFDPAKNADYAARYLRLLLVEAGGDWNVAVGLYHSHTPYLAAAYRNRVAAIGAGIVTGIGGPEALYPRALHLGVLRLPLAGGGMMTIRIGRQPTAPGKPRKTPCQVAIALAPLLHSPPKVEGCKVPARMPSHPAQQAQAPSPGDDPE